MGHYPGEYFSEVDDGLVFCISGVLGGVKS